MNLAKNLQMSGLAVGGAGVLLLGQADAARAITFLTNSATGNEYGVLNNASSWTVAQTEAQSLGGNLVTINDAAEQQWLIDQFDVDTYYWIGLTDQDQEGTFQWISGEASAYRNWHMNEPNSSTADEDFVAMNWFDSTTPGEWVDLPDAGPFTQFGPAFGLVERAVVAPAAAAPVPTPALLPGLLGFGMSLVRKKRKQGVAA